MNNNYAHIELNITSKTKNVIGNSANYKNLAQWNDSDQGNVTSVGSNGNHSYYELYDTSGQVYEWTDDSDINQSELKICRGGCYADIRPFNISKEHRQKFHYNSMLNDGFFGFRIATLNNPNSYSNFVTVSNTGNAPDKCDENLFGTVNYTYQINKYLVTNSEYCEFLNSVDPSGTNVHQIYDYRMSSSAVGGINVIDCNGAGSKYVVKNNMSNKPVTFVKWLMAAKYVNWLHSNKSSSPINHIYSGAYYLTDIIETLNIKTKNSFNLLTEDDKAIVTDQNFSLLNHSNLNSNIVRDPSATYFLPNEDEWYKAAYYDPTIQSYWKYGTRSDKDPYAVICDSTGSGQYVEGYHYSVKKFPILVNKISNITDPPTLLPNNPNGCPSVFISGSPVGSGLSYTIESSITGLVYGEKYSYDFASSIGNWPAKITPLSGSFLAYSSKQEINAILQLCPKNYNDISQCGANLNYHQDSDNDLYTNLILNVRSTSCSNTITENLLIPINNLPSITVKPGLNIEFADSHENGIIVSENLCCNPIPIVVAVSGHQPGEVYSYSLFSSSDKIKLIPDSGTVSFGDQVGKITAYAVGLNDNLNNISILIATIINNNNINDASTDQVLLQCISNCEKSCDNHANYNNKAIWGSCAKDCNNSPIPRLVGSVTTVGTNGGSGSYGTYDMDGNVWEIIAAGYTLRYDNYTPPTGWVLSSNPSIRGGSFKNLTVGKSARQASSSPEAEDVGFRIASYNNPYNYSNMVAINDIGSPLPTGNVPDVDSLNGKVPYSFMIGKYPVTNCEYVEFLNSVASTGVALTQINSVYSPLMSGCYGGIDRIVCGSTYAYYVQDCMDHKPVRFLPPLAASRYSNWLSNNKEDGWNSTTSGAYDATFIRRIDCAKYFIPSEDEWYKAAYYKGSNTGDTNAGYWDYSTKASISPEPVSASGCGHGYKKYDCDQTEIQPPCMPTPTPNACTPTSSPTPTVTPTISVSVSPTPTPIPNCCEWDGNGILIFNDIACGWTTKEVSWNKISDYEWTFNETLDCDETIDISLICDSTRPISLGAPTPTPTSTPVPQPTSTPTPTPEPIIQGINAANHGNQANWNGNRSGNVTTVGSNGRPSAYGTYDQTGNVHEWNDLDGISNIVPIIGASQFWPYAPGSTAPRGWRSGLSWFSSPTWVRSDSAFRYNALVRTYQNDVGFRIASLTNPFGFPNFVSVEDAGNTPDTKVTEDPYGDNTSGYGSVNYNYFIGKYLVTNCEYALFLNSIDPQGIINSNISYSSSFLAYHSEMNSNVVGGISLVSSNNNGSKYVVKNNMGSKPVVFVNWYDCAYYCNWLHNGANTYSTTADGINAINSGAYNITPGIRGPAAKQIGAKYYIPNENEWYKAAYYKGGGTNSGYWIYATQSDSAPIPVSASETGDGLINGQPARVSDYVCP